LVGSLVDLHVRLPLLFLLEGLRVGLLFDAALVAIVLQQALPLLFLFGGLVLGSNE